MTESSRHSGPLIGREAELAQLGERLRRIRQGEGQVVGIIGGDGIGKTRLLIQLQGAAEAQDISWFALQISEHGQRAGFHAIVDLLRALFGLNEQLPTGIDLNAVLARLLPVEDCPSLVAALGSYLGIAGIGESLEPEVRRRLLIRALQQAVHALSTRGPLVIAIDDAQWVDSSSLELLGEMVAFFRQLPVLLITCSPTGASMPWHTGEFSADLLALDGLDEEGTSRFLQAITGQSLDQQTIAFLVERTAGNPLFLRSFAGLAMREQNLEEEQGVWHLPLRKYFLVQASLEELYRQVIERCGESIRLALGPAVTLGGSFSLHQLRELVSTERTWAVPDTLLRTNLERLLEQDLIERRAQPDVYRFPHSLTRRVATEFVPELRARRLHTLVGRLLELETTQPQGMLIEDLAYHYALGDRAPKAVEYHARAAEHAMSVQAHAEALWHYRSALDRLNEISSGQEKQSLNATLHAGLAAAEKDSGEYELAEADYRVALAATVDPLVRASIWHGLAALLAQQWRHQDALAEIAKEEVLLRVTGDNADEMSALAIARLMLDRITLLRALGWYADAQQVAEEGLVVLDALDLQFDSRLLPPVQDAVAGICTELGEIQISRRQPAWAEEALRRALALQERLGNRKPLAQVFNQLAHLAWLRGDLEAAAEHYQRARELQTDLGDLRGSALSTHNLALVYWRQWKLSDAEAYLLEALAGLELVGELKAMPAAIANLERIYWYRGDFERLQILHEKELALAEEAGWRLDQANEVFSGRLALEHGDWAIAEQHLRLAVEMVAEHRDETNLEIALLLGQALLGGGRIEEASRILRQALSRAKERRLSASIGLLELAVAELEFRKGNYVAAGESASVIAAVAEAPDQRPRLGTRHLLGRYYSLRGRLATVEGRWEDAEAAFQYSLELLESIEAYLEAARTRLAWTEALIARDGQPSKVSAANPAGESMGEDLGAKIQMLLADALDVFQTSGLVLEQKKAKALLRRYPVTDGD
ncbi:MAG: ATP-binding protein [Dehalococcoidia bacterium]